MKNAKCKISKQHNLKVVFKDAEMRLLLLHLAKPNGLIKLLAIVEAHGGDVCCCWVS